MKVSLKYLVPFLVLFVGVIAMSVNMYFYIDNENMERIETSKKKATIIGHRIANEIEKRHLYAKSSHSDLIRIVSQYSLEQLNVVKVFDEKSKILFKSTPVKFLKENDFNLEATLRIVKNELEANVFIDEEETYIDITIPLLMPNSKVQTFKKNYGALFLQFDMNDAKTKSEKRIIKHGIHNGLVILLMVVSLAILIYLLILKPLTKLHKSTMKLANGDMSVRVKVNSKNELGDLNRSFNDMAEEISKHQNELEHKIEDAVIKNTEQNSVMLQQGRLAAMGEMINNIAHQWRQPLNTLGLIIQKIELLHDREQLSSEKLEESVKKSQMLIDRMSTTIDDFRDFFSQGKVKDNFLLEALMDDVLSFMEGTLKEYDIEVSVKIEKLTKIYGYKNELMQVIVNIINNAKDALVENNVANKKITISCHAKNDELLLEIGDNAGGIPQEIIEKIFDPYFTTKEEGKGSGIGLYMSKTIIEENMQGRFSVINKGNGAAFIIKLLIDNTHPYCDSSIV